MLDVRPCTIVAFVCKTYCEFELAYLCYICTISLQRAIKRCRSHEMDSAFKYLYEVGLRKHISACTKHGFSDAQSPEHDMSRIGMDMDISFGGWGREGASSREILPVSLKGENPRAVFSGQNRHLALPGEESISHQDELFATSCQFFYYISFT